MEEELLSFAIEPLFREAAGNSNLSEEQEGETKFRGC